MIKIFYDVETTGLNYKLHSIHQLTGIIEVDDEAVESFDFKIRPHSRAEITPTALGICKVTEEEIRAYPEMQTAYMKLIAVWSKYIDAFDPKDKAFLIGFNNIFFDDNFLRMFFELNGDRCINSWVWGNALDVMVLATQYLLDRRVNMPSFKLHRVAKELGILVDDSRLHEALYDVELTRAIYRIVTGLVIEL